MFPRNASRVLLAISYAIGQRSIRSRLTGTGLLRGARGLSAQYGSRFGKSLRNKCGPWPSVPTSNPSKKKATLLWNRAGKATDPAPAIIVVDAVAAHAEAFASSRRALCFWQRTFPSNACRWIKSEADPFKRLEGQRNPHFSIISMRRRYVFFLSATRNTIGS